MSAVISSFAYASQMIGIKPYGSRVYHGRANIHQAVVSFHGGANTYEAVAEPTITDWSTYARNAGFKTRSRHLVFRAWKPEACCKIFFYSGCSQVSKKVKLSASLGFSFMHTFLFGTATSTAYVEGAQGALSRTLLKYAHLKWFSYMKS